MQHHLPWLGSVPGPVVGWFSSVSVVEVEGELVAGDLAGGDGSAYVEGVGRSQREQLLRAFRDGVVEVEGVGEVELAGELAGAAEGDLLVVDGEVPTVRSLPCFLGGLVGHEPGDRLGDQPLQSGDADAVRERCHLGVHERRCLRGQAECLLCDPAGTPRLEVTCLHPGPAAREAVLQLDGRRDQCPAAVGGAADGQGELGDAELRHQWRAFTCQREAGVSAGGEPGGCLVDGLRWVLLGPGHRGKHQHSVRAHRCSPGLARYPQHLSRGVEVLAVVLGVAGMSEFKHRAPTETGENSAAVEGNSRLLRSGPVVKVGFSAYGVWSRLFARFARSSTTGASHSRRRAPFLASFMPPARAQMLDAWERLVVVVEKPAPF